MQTTTPTLAQRERQHRRKGNGQYERNDCYGCGKAAPMEYYSDPRTDKYIDGFNVADALLCLCGRCSDFYGAMSDQELADFLRSHTLPFTPPRRRATRKAAPAPVVEEEIVWTLETSDGEEIATLTPDGWTDQSDLIAALQAEIDQLRAENIALLKAENARLASRLGRN